MSVLFCVVKVNGQREFSAFSEHPYLVSCGHNSYHRELMDLHLCDSHRGQESYLWRAHVGALCEHTLPTFNVMTNRSVLGEQREWLGKGKKKGLIGSLIFQIEYWDSTHHNPPGIDTPSPWMLTCCIHTCRGGMEFFLKKKKTEDLDIQLSWIYLY